MACFCPFFIFISQINNMNALSEPKPFSPHQCLPIKQMLSPANPIMTKSVPSFQQKPNLKIELIKSSAPQKQTGNKTIVPPSIVKEIDKVQLIETKTQSNKLTLENGYDESTILFKKYQNEKINKRNGSKYFASLFIALQDKGAKPLPSYKGMLYDNDLLFDSNYSSANLMAVYLVGKHTYDLILQNDLNTKGFTQWYNFKVKNQKNNFIAKFNIVNLYKQKSLYSIGMKPIVRSEKSDKNSKKTWRRRGFNIFYDRNDLNYEDDTSKFYKTLSFDYDFTVEKDEVQFAHGMPYDLQNLQLFLQGIKSSAKATFLTIGNTLMGKPIPLVKIASVDKSNTSQKKAIVILARQHPGQTPGSFIVEQVLSELIKNSHQVEFLVWRFDIYVFPMVNLDGVDLGNYRGNFAGFDLNRCWTKPDPIKQPEVFLIKNYIKKLHKKQAIDLILDLHGHSRKMGSFFYGNNFGNNYQMFPFIAAKCSKNILFEQSRFSNQTKAKASTARVVLGNMIRDTGNVYTYQVSFFGNYKEDGHTPFSFTEDHYKQMGKALVISIYRTFVQIYKEEKTLKESMYLKNIKQQLGQVNIIIKTEPQSEEGSDSEAEHQTQLQFKQLQSIFLNDLQQDFLQPPIEIIKKIDDETVICKKGRDFHEYESVIDRHNQQIKKKIQDLYQNSLNQGMKNVLLQRLPGISQPKEPQISQLKDDKHYLILNSIINSHDKFTGIDSVKKRKLSPDRLKVRGEVFELRLRGKARSQKAYNSSSETQQVNNHNSHYLGHNLEIIANAAMKHSFSKQKPIRSINTLDLNSHVNLQHFPFAQDQQSQKSFNIKNSYCRKMPPNDDLPRVYNEQMRNVSFERNFSMEDRLKKSIDSNTRKVHKLEGDQKQRILKLPLL